VASQLGIAAILVLKLYPAYAEEQRDGAARSEALRNVPKAGPPARGPTSPTISLFLVADNHFHELDGQRTGIHLDLADAIVRVAVRPVELDLLSGFTLARFARTRKDRGIAWMHLGDDADLGCTAELDRLGTYLGVFGEPPIALVPGNHDNKFVGNFAWHPSWGVACGRSPRATKDTGDAILHAFSPSTSSVRVIGQLAGADVVGVFVDTTDSSTVAIAGAQGAISSAQEASIRGELVKWNQPWVIVFMHHPFNELTWGSQRSLAAIVGNTRPLAVVSAHTHVAALRSVDVNGVQIPEFIVGSTTDPPQETALLEIGENEPGNAAMRVVTIPAVARPGATCGEDVTTTVPASTCDAAFARARATCDEMVAAKGPPVEAMHPPSPADVKAGQQVRARALLACLQRLELLPTHFADAPLDDPTLFPKLDALARTLAIADDPEAKAKLDQLTCFSWAGAALQRHKGEPGWSYAHALDVSTSPETVYAATEMTFDRRSGAGTQRSCTTPPAQSDAKK
jgi:hypothetical protein